MTFPVTHPALSRALAERDYTSATPVQTAVVTEEAEGRDLLVSAQTGSGKTIAFGLHVRALGSLRVVLDGHLAKATRNRLEGARGSFPLGENHRVW